MSSRVRLKGLNWGHRRATAPIAAATAAFRRLWPEVDISWNVQPLAGFENALGPDVAAQFDFIVFDHPFCGSISEAGYFLPMPEDGDLADPAMFVGPSLTSYRYSGALWGVPIDAATQTAVFRPDLLAPFGPPPRTWDEVVDLGRRVRVTGKWLGIAAFNPHGFLILAALCANFGRPLACDPLADPFDRRSMSDALEALSMIQPYLHPSCAEMNAIALHEAMQVSNDIVYCPISYCYLTHAEADWRRPLAFSDFPGPRAPYVAGTVLGGTGLGISSQTSQPDIAKKFGLFLAQADVQLEVFSQNHGQPARVEAWDDREADRRFGEALTGTRATIEAASVRPRYRNYVRFQHEAGELIGRTFPNFGGRTAVEELYRIWDQLRDTA
jgi:multiple sugar transport system substrate-binding protein